ncbi:putative polypeptide N-acetylgalactosaminyltransferase 8 [Sminthopsis crassicaudata]|uniref:putative polypeptide N-acetylgalactosaminyltransferase 8 n=1 Tax=Sminthopsis crassicaudata TaxID=9301 RepID=UPI003D682D3B
MMQRKSIPRIFSMGLILLCIFHILFVFYTKRIIQNLKSVRVQQGKNPFHLSTRDAAARKQLSFLDLNSTRHTLKANDVKHPEAIDKPPIRLEDEGKQNSETPDAKTKKRIPLFLEWRQSLTKARRKQAWSLFLKFGYNAYFSNGLPLNRSIPDTRSSRCLTKNYPSQLPTLSVILIFLDEAMSVIQRAITSIINRTPSHLLKELILVDDFSSHNELKDKLDKQMDLYALKYPGLLKLIRHTKRKGIAGARNSGWQAATSDVVVILDAHIEVNIGWAEPILARIQEDHTVIVTPMFDNIHFNSFKVIPHSLAAYGFNWLLWCRYDPLPKDWLALNDDTAPVKSPSIFGIFGANRLFLEEIGLLDGGMQIYGGENVELSLRVWQCGGKIEVLPCSRVAHLERAHKPYAPKLGLAIKHNALRVAEVWMDEYKSMVYFFWNLPLENPGIEYGDISPRKELQKKLKCKSFDWYLKNVYPSLKPIQNIVGYGKMKNSANEHVCIDEGPFSSNTPILENCKEYRSQLIFYCRTGEFYVGRLYAEWYWQDRCLIDPGEGHWPILKTCTEAINKELYMYWDFKQGAAVINRTTKRCLEIKNHSSFYILVLRECTGQIWTIQHTVREEAASRY